MDLSRQLRSAALVCFISLVLIHSSNSRYHGKRHKRQNGAHMYLPESFIVPNGEGVPHEWSEWSSPSECSRSCGGGVSFQTRECYAPNGVCRGGSRKYFSCNTQDCPEEESDFRAQQCSRFDSVPFDGVRYEWVPYTNAPNPCELNCMPRGERFYYRHKAKVIDGTRCNDKTLDVCVDGECQPVGCDMMLGSTAREDKCRKCAGDGSSCKTISGLFETNNLAAGYNDILLIPVGATNIVLKEVASSNNYLACRNLTGHYYLNGNWRIDFPRPMHFAGSWWHYQRKPTGFAAPDQLTCSGPTTESIYVVMLIQDQNVGVQYEYSIPESVTKNLPDAYSWTHMEFSPCSASCGGGIQSRNVTCNNRLTLEQVDDSLCDTSTKPNETQICATEECAPRWVEGVWQKCSKACGKDGLQKRTVSCERTSSNAMTTVLEDKVCLKAIGNKPATEQECNRDVQNCPKFHTGPWSPCDKLCGEGKRSRKVTCFQEQNGRKKVLPDSECSDNKPETEESCMLAPCDGVDWIVSQWSGCGNCGQIKETRTAICGSKSGKKYDAKFCLAEKPQLSRPCISTKCQTQWFTSQWSECSSKCGKGIQSRIVICGEFNGDKVTPAADDSKCNAVDKPEQEQECESKEAKCPGEWFTGPWGDCSKTCGGGQRTREVLCLANGTKVSTCEESKIEFTSENCNSQACTNDETIPINSTDKSIDDDEDSDEECDEDYEEQDFGVELLPKKRKEDLKLGAGVEFDTASTISSSLIMDDLMLSDSPTTGDKSTTVDSSTELPETTVEGSGEGTAITIVSTNDVSEGSADGDEEKFTTGFLSTEYMASTEQTTDKTESSSFTSLQLSTTDIILSSEIPSEAAFTSVTDVSDSSSSKIGSTSETTVLSNGTPTTESTLADTSIISTNIGDISTAYTDLLSLSSISSLSLTESSTIQGLTESTSQSALYSETAVYSTPHSSFEPTTVDSTQTTLDSSSGTTTSSAAALSSSTVTTSEINTMETTPGDINVSETTYDSSTDTTLISSTETTLESSTETTSESSTETTLENSTGTTLESSTDTEITSESTLEVTSETSSDSTSDSSSTTILHESSIETTSENTEASLKGSTETLIESTTLTTSDVTGISQGSSTDLTSEETSQTMGASTEASTYDSLKTTEIVSTSSDITESSVPHSSIETSTDETSFETSETSETKTNDLVSTVSYSESTIGISTSDKSELTESTSLTTEENKPSESSTIYTSEGRSDATTESQVHVSDASPTSDLSTSDDSSFVETTTVIGIELSSTDITTQEITDKSPPSSDDVTTVDIWSSESTEITEVDISQATPNTLEAALDREAKPRKCKPRRPKKDSCLLSNFGCCPDKKTQAKGPFGLGCPVIKTCADSQFGCCPDGLSPSEGNNNKGCPKSMCAETLFGCCQDNYTPAEGEDNEGCPEPTTEPPTTTITPEVEETEATTFSIDLTEVTESSSDTTKEYDASESTDTTETTAKSNIADEGGCSKSQYGCCRDGKHPALGPNEEGCASCTQEPFGCCADDVTPAHGVLGEGCCLSSRFGCCPDNINAARGPNFEDCDCRYTPYGCCPDNTTAAHGYNNDGCGCEFSPFGCCPDKLTPSEGHKFGGCPCHTMQFGCCPDGITIPQGPHHYGCHCSQTQYKCCSDEKTPAKGPNFEGCTCAESKYGCCPDGTTDAQGSKFEGCEIIQESPQKSCGLPKETGACSNFTIKYFFDTSYGACARFWYGGCDGNGNRFETEAECRDTCQEYKGKDTCLLPKSAGPCPGFQKKWYFNSERNRCEEFNYGGCYGTSNRFDSLEECNAQCSVEDSLPPCDQPMDQGPCHGNFERWFYDNATDVCRQFTYGGCKGNKNNYATEHGCNYHCRQPGVHKELCALPKENGSCAGNHARWHFSESEQKCLPFYYTGCGGNKNNFQTLESCEEHCPKKIAKDVCEIPAEVGECQNYVPRWYWDTKDERCRQFYYGGCGGNGNNFAGEEECSQRCKQKPEMTTTPRSRQPTRQRADRPTQRPDSAVNPDRVPTLDNAVVQAAEERCFQPAEAGECEEYIHRWFYNADEGLCDQFIYRGCRGNDNNFGSEEECENSCFHVHSTCSLQPVYGRCNDNTTRWHYDESTKRCYEFEFSGCRGNRNNFFTEQECKDYCQNVHPEEDSPHTESYSNTPDHQCELPVETGNCRDNILSWYYNKESKQCVGFYYSGCNGNANRFQSKEQCHHQCGHKDVDETIKNNQIDSRSDFLKPSADRCETFEAQCNSLQCAFGAKSIQGSDGCRRCECINPCADYSCLDEEKCAVDVSSDPSSEVRFVPVCRQISKPGECPPLLNRSMCHRECYDDADCRGDNKCCSEGCSQVCVNPYQPEVQTTSLRPPSPITDSIFPGESPAVLEPKKPEEVEVTSSTGSVAVLRCFATGNPPPIVTWRRGAVLIDTNKGRYVLTSSGDLTIVQVHQSDSGSYICVASNGLGTPVTREVNLQVSETKQNVPAYIYGPKNLTQIVVLKQPAVIRCPAGGNPKPHVNWWRGKNRMALTTPRYDTKRDYSLVFRSVELADLGPYECSAWTGHGKPASMVVVLKAVGPVHASNRNEEKFLKYVITPALIQTTSKPVYSFRPTRPRIVDLGSRFGGEKELVTSPPYRKSVSATAIIRRDSSNNYTIGSDIVLNCEVGGYPAPNVTWLKDNKQILPSNRVQITENPYRLVIYGVAAEDSGYYGCTATNAFSFNTSEEKILIESGVYVRPDCIDNEHFANCALIVKGRYCSNNYYARFCCRSCTLAGQLPGHPNSL